MTTGLIPAAIDATLVLVRHGESTWIVEGRFQGRADPPLSPRGERQASLVAARLADLGAPMQLPIPAGPALAIWHSPLQRARVTATIIADAQHRAGGRTPVIGEAGLTELAQGDWEGLYAAEVVERYGAQLARWRSEPAGNEAPGGERLADADDRAREALARILEDLAQARVGDAPADPGRSPVPGYGPPPPQRPWGVAVAHDGVFRLALMALLDVPLARFWTLPFVLCGITVVELHAGRAVLRAHNLADHLAPIAAEEADRRSGL